MDLKQLPFTNVIRRPVRTAALLIIVLLLATAMLGGILVMHSLQKGLESLQTRLGADIIVVPDEAKSKTDLESILLDGVPGYFYMDRSIYEKIADREDVECVSAQYYMASAKAGCCAMPVQIIGFDPETDFTVTPWIRRSGGDTLAAGDLVIGCNVNKPVGSSLTFFDVPCQVVAQLDRTGTALDNAVYGNYDTIRQLIEGSKKNSFKYFSNHNPDQIVSSVLINVKDGVSIDEVVGDINIHMKGAEAISTKSMLSGVSDSLAGISSIVRLLLVLIWILLLVILFIIFYTMIHERKKECAVLRVVGISRRMLAVLILKESAIVALAGGMLGALISVAGIRIFSGLLENRLGMPFLAPEMGYILLWACLTLVASVVTCGAAASYTAWKLARVDTGLILREGN